jgi:hypothetical protein
MFNQMFNKNSKVQFREYLVLVREPSKWGLQKEHGSSWGHSLRTRFWTEGCREFFQSQLKKEAHCHCLGQRGWPLMSMLRREREKSRNKSHVHWGFNPTLVAYGSPI